MLALPKNTSGNPMRRLIASAVVLAILAEPVSAQKRRDDDPLIIMEREKQQQAQEVDKQYKRTLDRTRKDGDAPRSNDPWANMRGPSDGKR